ncbi:hypothetical protein JCM30471_18990 [Desulfuromonas carbonis]
MSRILLLIVVATLCQGLFSMAFAMSDEEMTNKIIGEWYAEDENGSTVYLFNKDGSWTENGVYYFKDGPKEVSLEGKWYIEKSHFYHSVVKCNLPAKIKEGKFDKIKIKYVSDNEFFMLLAPGNLAPHFTKK